MSPYEKTKDGDRNARERNKLVSEYLLSRKIGDQFADHAHSRQDHDVNGRMGIEPEHVLEQDRIATDGWIENADMYKAFDREEKNRDRDNGRSQYHHQAGRILCPNKQRQAEPGHPWCTHRVNGDDKIQTCKNGRKSIDKDPEADRHHV